MSYKVVYIDEVDADIRSFKRSVALRANEKFEVIPIKPKEDILETVEEIFSAFPDAVVADFRLSEEAPEVHYNGADVIKEILTIREDFPVFILTSFEEDAEDKGFDVNIIYEKVDVQESSKFFDKVILQIKKHKARIESAEVRIIELQKKLSEESLTSSEEQELMDLDSLVSKSLDKRGFIQENIRISSNTDRLQALIKKADDIIEAISKQKNQ
jgi:DNA-binding NarL/FixJ family response regulator